MGVAATDWDDIAKKEHLDDLHTELKKLEVTVKEVDSHMVALRKREEEMRDLNGEQAWLVGVCQVCTLQWF